MNNKVEKPICAVMQNTNLRFSAHAIKRLKKRDIVIDDVKLKKLENAIQEADQKGAKESLVIMNESALIVNIKNKIVVTAVPLTNGDKNIFTNIDTVVFA
ncbi:MAG TPA: TIGR02530 family flagellar biosynthesis protein [Ignavibacteriales bacterium]|nr:TIGR02530 family flagellar biosynthesis protein [Ignavibacteriales bacterium]